MNKFLDNHKSKLGGVGLILASLGYFLNQGLADGFQFSDLTTLLAGVASGMAVLGLAGKLHKLLEVFKTLSK